MRKVANVSGTCSSKGIWASLPGKPRAQMEEETDKSSDKAIVMDEGKDKRASWRMQWNQAMFNIRMNWEIKHSMMKMLWLNYSSSPGSIKHPNVSKPLLFISLKPRSSKTVTTSDKQNEMCIERKEKSLSKGKRIGWEPGSNLRDWMKLLTITKKTQPYH